MIRDLLDRALAGRPLSRQDNLRLLRAGLATAGKADGVREEIFQAARALRGRYFGKRIFLYGFLYISTYCRNNCIFCAFRSSNKALQRYRKSTPRIVEAALSLAATGIHLLDLTTGEDPLFHDDPELRGLAGILEAVKNATSLPLMVSPGVVPERGLRVLKEAGADWYACYQESFDRGQFARLRPGQDYGARLRCKQEALRSGLLVEEGVLTGTGESLESLAGSIEAMIAGGYSQVRAMQFVPGPGIPLAVVESHPYREAVLIAVLRLNCPQLLIPASLDVEGLGGLDKRLAAGANVVTSIVPRGRGYCGVASQDLDIENGKRSLGRVLDIAGACGLEPAQPGDLLSWMEERRSPVFPRKAGLTVTEVDRDPSARSSRLAGG